MKYISFVFIFSILFSCVSQSEIDSNSQYTEQNSDEGNFSTTNKNLLIDFEGFSKPSYKKQIIHFNGTGNWILEGALIGSSEDDLEDGKSLRIKPQGYFQFEGKLSVTNGLISFSVANYGSDNGGEIAVEYSTDQITWKKINSTTYKENEAEGRNKYIFKDLNLKSAYFRIVNNTLGNKSRVNIDDIAFVNFIFNPEENSIVKTDSNSIGASDELSKKQGNQINQINEELIELVGNVSNADNIDKNNYLIKKKSIVISYNNKQKIPNWVAWHLSSEDIGSLKRGDFSASTYLPENFNHLETQSYTNTGFSRGHLCPSGDRTNDIELNQEVFEMDNIAPQLQELNGGAWETLEKYCREVSKSGKEVYIIAGVFGEGGENIYHEHLTMTKTGITVPAIFWKVVLILKKGENDISRIQKNSIAFGVWMPNNFSSKGKKFRDYLFPVDEIEKRTGYDFFKILNDKIENEIEGKLISPKELETEKNWR